MIKIGAEAMTIEEGARPRTLSSNCRVKSNMAREGGHSTWSALELAIVASHSKARKMAALKYVAKN